MNIQLDIIHFESKSIPSQNFLSSLLGTVFPTHRKLPIPQFKQQFQNKECDGPVIVKTRR